MFGWFIRLLLGEERNDPGTGPVGGAVPDTPDRDAADDVCMLVLSLNTGSALAASPERTCSKKTTSRRR